MKVQRKGGIRLLFWTGAALLLAFLVGVPREAAARYYRPIDPPYPEGDPTADDQPSPTPKLSRNQMEYQTAAIARTRDKRFGLYGRRIWLSYVQAWIRISVR